MTEWWRRPYWGFDVESTGVDREEDRIVTATLTHVFPDGTTPTQSTTWVIDPGVEIPTGASDLHGYTTERARAEGRPPAEALTELAMALENVLALGEAVCVYNAPFDFTMADREFRRHLGGPLWGGRPLPPVVVDPLVIDKRVNERVRGKGQRQLMNTARRWGVTLSKEDAHTSAGDVLATVRLAWKQAMTVPFVGDMALHELHLSQKKWYHAQTLDFAAWKRGKGEVDEARRIAAEADDWAMRPFVPSSPPAPEPAF